MSRFAFRIEGKGVDIGKAYSADLVGIYFDLDDDSERSSPNQPYELGINLVYDSSDGAHAQQAKRAATKLRDLIARKCKKSGQWRWIELTYCEAVSDQIFPLYAARTFRRWRFEHRSVSGEPVDRGG